MSKPIRMITKKTWKEFMDCGLLWWVNRMLHLFGWAIVVEEGGVISHAYPARVKFRGFEPDVEDAGFIKLTKHLKTTVKALEKEAGGS